MPHQKWGCSVVLQALNNHTNFISNGITHAQSGTGTATHLTELGIIAIGDTINGAHLYITRKSRANIDASQTPLEAEFMYEVAKATIKAGIDRTEGNAVLQQLASTINGRAIEEGPDHVNECYDWVHHKPLDDYQRIYNEVVETFRDSGVPVLQ
jgi:hypothetical protein